jgi:hypothetical protein
MSIRGSVRVGRVRMRMRQSARRIHIKNSMRKMGTRIRKGFGFFETLVKQLLRNMPIAEADR